MTQINFSAGVNGPSNVSFGNSANPQNVGRQRGPISFGGIKYEEKQKYNSDGTITYQYYNKGVLSQETKYKVLPNGKEVIAEISKFDEKIDNNNNVIKTISTYVDEDGDGYDDYCTVKTFKNGKLVEENKIINEDINDVKNRDDLPSVINNRKMSTIDSGYMERSIQ